MRRPAGMCLLLLPVVAGCSSWKRPPWPHPSVNARTDSYGVLCADLKPSEDADVALVVRHVSCEEFADRRKGDWIRTWYVLKFAVLLVEEGAWDASELSFICGSAWPTLESGIMLSLAPGPYRPGWEYRFWLDSRLTPAQIVGQETLTRSPVAPMTNP
jgi:hypothetical protein